MRSNESMIGLSPVALLFACFGFSVAAQAGSKVSFDTTGACQGETSAMRIDGSRFRADSVAGGQRSSLLYDGVERTMTSLLHESRQYMLVEVDEDALDYQGDVAESTGNFMNKQMEKMESQMAQQCADMRKQGMECPDMDMRGMMQGMMASQLPTWRDMQRNGEVSGVACRWWERSLGGQKIKEECRAKLSALPIGDRDRRGLERGVKVMQRYGSNMMGMMSGLTGEAAPPVGLPKDEVVIEQVCVDADGMEDGRSTAKFAEESVDESVFEIPSGYSQLRMDGASP